MSAERLKRKYLKQIENDPETFIACTETIVRQVGDIGRMVDEFSSFARMPTPMMEKVDLAKICRDALVLQKTGHSTVKFIDVIGDKKVLASCDTGQIGQALTNLVQNALDSIEGRQEEERTGDMTSAPGEIQMELRTDYDGQNLIVITDNGKGLPKQGRDRLTEPYVTTRQKGTGLGLAIVKKIMEDHGGLLTLEDAPDGGARVTLRFPPLQQEPVEENKHINKLEKDENDQAELTSNAVAEKDKKNGGNTTVAFVQRSSLG